MLKFHYNEKISKSRLGKFAKSLSLDTLSEIFSGHKELFKRLYIYDKHDFKPYREYAEICGYTHDDLLTVFKDRIESANLDLVKK